MLGNRFGRESTRYVPSAVPPHSVRNDERAIVAHDDEAILIVVALKPNVTHSCRYGAQSDLGHHLCQPANGTVFDGDGSSDCIRPVVKGRFGCHIRITTFLSPVSPTTSSANEWNRWVVRPRRCAD